jgi:O-phosphoseryl-tRNA(Cys) synthetase
MLWHDRSRWQARREEQSKKVETMTALIESYKRGELSYTRLADKIDEVVNGDTDSIVRVGEAHKLEIKS